MIDDDNFVSGYKSKRGTSGGHELPTTFEWKFGQKKLVKDLQRYGIIGESQLLKPSNDKWLSPSERCRYVDEDGDRCPERALPRAKRLKLCQVHRLQRTRELTAKRTRKWREKQGSDA